MTEKLEDKLKEEHGVKNILRYALPGFVLAGLGAAYSMWGKSYVDKKLSPEKKEELKRVAFNAGVSSAGAAVGTVVAEKTNPYKSAT